MATMTRAMQRWADDVAAVYGNQRTSRIGWTATGPAWLISDDGRGHVTRRRLTREEIDAVERQFARTSRSSRRSSRPCTRCRPHASRDKR